MKKKLFVVVILISFVSLGCASAPTDTTPTIIYLHGRIVEDMGPAAQSQRFGRYEYRAILEEFERKDFKVTSEVRPKNTDPKIYGRKLAKTLDELIGNGKAANSITVVGASKGALIAMIASSELKNSSVNFVLMGSCNQWVLENYKLDLHGRILSIYEKTDTLGGESCEKIKTASTGISEFKEIEINTGLDHGFLYRPIKDWFEPTVSWATNKEN